VSMMRIRALAALELLGCAMMNEGPHEGRLKLVVSWLL